MIWNTIELLLRHLELALRVHAATPTLPMPEAYAHVIAAEEVAAGPVTAELLLGVAFVESRYDPTAVSRVVGRTRSTGRYPSRVPPANLDVRASLFCGPLQTYATSWSMCLAMRNLRTGYRAGVSELQQWLKDPRVRGNVTRALAGHGCGYHGVITGACNGYPGRVIAMERRFRVGVPPRARASQTSVASR
jgi:hypothetical protein